MPRKNRHNKIMNSNLSSFIRECRLPLLAISHTIDYCGDVYALSDAGYSKLAVFPIDVPDDFFIEMCDNFFSNGHDIEAAIRNMDLPEEDLLAYTKTLTDDDFVRQGSNLFYPNRGDIEQFVEGTLENNRCYGFVSFTKNAENVLKSFAQFDDLWPSDHGRFLALKTGINNGGLSRYPLYVRPEFHLSLM